MKKSSLFVIGLSIIALSQMACAMERDAEEYSSRRSCWVNVSRRLGRLWRRGTRNCSRANCSRAVKSREAKKIAAVGLTAAVFVGTCELLRRKCEANPSCCGGDFGLDYLIEDDFF